MSTTGRERKAVGPQESRTRRLGTVGGHAPLQGWLGSRAPWARPGWESDLGEGGRGWPSLVLAWADSDCLSAHSQEEGLITSGTTCPQRLWIPTIRGFQNFTGTTGLGHGAQVTNTARLLGPGRWGLGEAGTQVCWKHPSSAPSGCLFFPLLLFTGLLWLSLSKVSYRPPGPRASKPGLWWQTLPGPGGGHFPERDGAVFPVSCPPWWPAQSLSPLWCRGREGRGGGGSTPTLLVHLQRG